VHEAYDRLRSGGAEELVASWYVFAVIGAAIVVDMGLEPRMEPSLVAELALDKRPAV